MVIETIHGSLSLGQSPRNDGHLSQPRLTTPDGILISLNSSFSQYINHYDPLVTTSSTAQGGGGSFRIGNL